MVIEFLVTHLSASPLRFAWKFWLGCVATRTLTPSFKIETCQAHQPCVSSVSLSHLNHPWGMYILTHKYGCISIQYIYIYHTLQTFPDLLSKICIILKNYANVSDISHTLVRYSRREQGGKWCKIPPNNRGVLYYQSKECNSEIHKIPQNYHTHVHFWYPLKWVPFHS